MVTCTLGALIKQSAHLTFSYCCHCIALAFFINSDCAPRSRIRSRNHATTPLLGRSPCCSPSIASPSTRLLDGLHCQLLQIVPLGASSEGMHVEK
eukprot:6191962-Pleurochrysis_carterae.AAC.3